MYKIPIDEIKAKIVESKKLSLDDLNKKIKDKINELSGLISEEGAAHIIANELGIALINETDQKLKIKEIYSGMRQVSTVGKVTRKWDIREFSKGDNVGKVCSIILGDETGTIRVVFWNDQVDLLNEVNEGDILAVNNGYVRENKMGGREVHLGDSGSIEKNPKGVKIGEVRVGGEFHRKKINELEPNDTNVEILGTIMEVYDPRFFDVCSQCNKRVHESDGKFSCTEHGEVEPSTSYVLNAVLDDGSDNIRCVFWKSQTNQLLNKEESEVVSFKDDLGLFEDIKSELKGKVFKLRGKVRNNDMFNRLELNIQFVEVADPKQELENIGVEEKIE